MIERTIYEQLKDSAINRPVTLLTGARQVGKTTLCLKLEKELGFEYVTLRDFDQCSMAVKDPEMFLHVHKWPLIIDEIQYAPGLFEYIESEVDKEKRIGDAKGMYVLTGSQAYELMKDVSDSLAGRISIIRMSPLSYNEIICRKEIPFKINIPENIGRSIGCDLNIKEFYERIIRGMYPEPEIDRNIRISVFYSDYVSTYIERDVSNIVNIVDKQKFKLFMQILASLTGQELVYSNIASAVGIDQKTVKSWISVLMAGDIIHLLEPYNDRSTIKRVAKRPKVYFWDTGLACYLAKIPDADSLVLGYLNGPMVETYIVNEILKSYRNNREEIPFYYYRDNNGKEIDLVTISNGEMSLIECKAGTNFGKNDVKSLVSGIPSQYPITGRCIICPAVTARVVYNGIYAIPFTAI